MVQLRVDVPNETLYLDYKAGAELNDTKKAARTLRQYVAGFANVDGGVLVVGFDEQSNSWGCPKLGTTLTEWASRSLQPLLPFFLGPPRIIEVPTTTGPVLLIATRRTPGLVPVSEDGELKYYVRLGESTVAPKFHLAPMPGPLVADILLGRRGQSDLRLVLAKVTGYQKDRSLTSLSIRFTVDNVTPGFADRVHAGAVYWAVQDQGNVSEHLRTLIDARPGKIASLSLTHTSSRDFEKRGPFTIGPLERRLVDIKLSHLPTPNPIRRGTIAMSAGIYISSETSVPRWYQLSGNYPELDNYVPDYALPGWSLSPSEDTVPVVTTSS